MKTPTETAFEHLKAHIGRHHEDLIEIGALAAEGLTQRVIDRSDEIVCHSTQRQLEAAKLMKNLSPEEAARVLVSLGLRPDYLDYLAALLAARKQLTHADSDVADALQKAHDLAHGRTV